MAIKNLIGIRDNRVSDEVDAVPSASQPVPRTVAPATAIDADTKFNGKLNCKESLRIDGRLKGELRCDNTVIIGEAAIVEATIHADAVVIFGEVKGDVFAIRKITLEASARMTGDLSTPGIVIEEGAKVRGSIVIGGEEQADKMLAQEARAARKPSQDATATSKGIAPPPA